MKLLFLVICMGMCLLASSLQATTYYVSSNGDDHNSGTSIEQAWATISRVNNMRFNPGDQILFEAGCVFEGGLYFGPDVKGTAINPIVISSFGGSPEAGSAKRAVISSGESYGLYVYNSAGFKVTQLAFEGAGRTLNNKSGIEFYMELPDTRLDYIFLDSLEISGYHFSGISIASWNGASGFDNITITNSLIHDNGDAGISTYAETQAVLGHRNMYVAYTKVYNNSGIPEKTHLHSGNGIVLGGVDGALIEYCEAYNNGWLNAWKDGGPVGIWGWHCNNLVIQHNESHHNKTGTGKDGGGFDIDGGCTNCTMQYNYSHDNDGPGYLIAQYFYAPVMKGVVVRYNISENDARNNSYGAIHLWSSGSNGGIQDIEVYNNTIYLTPADKGTPRAIYIQSGGVKNGKIWNNIFQTTGGLEMVYVDKITDVKFEGNNYWSGGSALSIKWGESTYTSLSNWIEATGQEKRNGLLVALSVDPVLADPGKGINIQDQRKLHTLLGYQIQAGSGLSGKGLDLKKEYGVEVGNTDFYGNSLELREVYSLGAHQPTENTQACLQGGDLQLKFGIVPGGNYRGPGVMDGGTFSPASVGVGNHGLVYSYQKEDGSLNTAHHTITVMETTSTNWTGKGVKSNDWFDSHNWSACVPTPSIDAVIPASIRTISADNMGVAPVISSGKLAQVKSLQAKGSVVVKAEGVLEINGTLTGDGVQKEASAVFVFKSDEEQEMPIGAFGNLVLKGKGIKKLSGPLLVEQKLELSESPLYLGDHPLTIASTGSVEGFSSSAYIVTDGLGSLVVEGVGAEKQALFPVGTIATYSPAVIENNGEVDDFSIRVEEGVFKEGTSGEQLKKGVVNKTWHIEEKMTGGSDVSLSLQWNKSDEMPDFLPRESFVSHYENEEWSVPAEVYDFPVSGSEDNSMVREMKNITSFSPFTVSTLAGFALPVRLGAFGVSQSGKDVVLRWVTLSEQNNQGFVPEVSTDGKHFRSLSFVPAKGANSHQRQQYSFTDSEKWKRGMRYYRLRQIDFDGAVSLSAIKALFFESVPVELVAYPNPFRNEITFRFTVAEEGEYTISLTDSFGRIVERKVLNMPAGSNKFKLLTSHRHPAGMYLLTLSSGDRVHRLKVFKEY